MSNNRSLKEIIEAKTRSGNFEFPILKGVAIQVQKAISNPNFDMDKVANIVEMDQGIAVKVLKMSNSAFFRGLKEVTSVRQAIVRIGVKNIRNILHTISQGNIYRTENPLFRETMRQLWKHALGCGIAAQWVAKRTGLYELADTCFLAGLLHDIGKLVILKVISELDGTNNGNSISDELILEIFEDLHTSEGDNLLSNWEIPDVYRRVVRDHHSQTPEQGDNLINTIKFADLTCHKLCIGTKHKPDIVLSATDEASTLGLKDIEIAELEVNLEEMLSEMIDTMS